jgi:iron-sulfur cluster assembly accessory protein
MKRFFSSHSSFIGKDLIITSKAINQLLKINTPLRISVDAGGCNGFQYKIQELLDRPSVEDIVIQQDTVKVVIDKVSLEYLKGSTLDYSQELIGCMYNS